MKIITIMFLMALLTGCIDEVSFTIDQAVEADEKCKNNEGSKTIAVRSYADSDRVNYITVTCNNEAVFHYKHAD